MRILTYFFLFIFLTSCTSNSIYERPKDLIPKDSMELLLTDMYLAAASKNKKGKNFKKKKTLLPLVFLKYEIDSTRFLASNNFYTSSIEGYNEILENVKNNLQENLTSFEDQIKLKDSLKKKKKTINIKNRKFKNDVKKGIISPLILRKEKIDSIPFYNKRFFNRSNNEEYNGILLISNDSLKKIKSEKNKKTIELLKSNKLK